MLAAELQEYLALIPVLASRMTLHCGQDRTIPMARGLWGAMLRQQERAAYDAVFEGGKDGPCYVLREAAEQTPARWTLEHILLGEGVRHAAAAWAAWQAAQAQGLGKAREAFRVEEVSTLSPDGHRNCEIFPSAIPAGAGPLCWPLSKAVWPAGKAPCTLLFATPLRVIHGGKLVTAPAPADVVQAVCRRVGSLLPPAEREGWNALRLRCLEAAKALEATPFAGTGTALHRYSARQEREMALHGVTGRLSLPHGCGELTPLLAAGLWLHVGKNAVFGMGNVRCAPLC